MLATLSMLAKAIVFAGALVLAWSLITVRSLIVRLPQGALRTRWYGMTALIVSFVAGYFGYAAIIWDLPAGPLDLIVPVVFLFGAIFVLLTVVLAFQTVKDLRRISRLEYETFTDPLTGMFNRRYMDRRLKEEVASARRYGVLLSVLLIDIDHFKRVNDTHGHQIGDQALLELAKTIGGELRETDFLARYGGEEFLVAALHTSPSGAVDLAERLRRRVEAREFALRDETGRSASLKLTVSIGVAFFNAGMEGVEHLVRAADENLYRAKAEGRNRVAAGDVQAHEPKGEKSRSSAE